MPEFHAEVPQATVSEGLAQIPYVAARAGVEPTTLRSTALDSTNEPPAPQRSLHFFHTIGSTVFALTNSNTKNNL